MKLDSFLDELEKIAASKEWLKKFVISGARKLKAEKTPLEGMKRVGQFSKKMTDIGTPKAIGLRQSAHGSFSSTSRTASQQERKAQRHLEAVARQNKARQVETQVSRPNVDEHGYAIQSPFRMGLELQLRTPKPRKPTRKPDNSVKVIPGVGGPKW